MSAPATASYTACRELAVATKVGPKGQIVIHRHIREQLGIEPGFLAMQRVVGDQVVIRFVASEHEKSLRGRLARGRKRSVDADAWPQAVADAWQLSVAEPEDDEYGG